MGGTYRLRMANDATLVMHADVVSEDYSYSNPNPLEETKIDGRTLANARVTYRSANESWSLAGYITNLTDEVYATNRINAFGAYGSRFEIVGAPRQAGLTFSLFF